MKSSILFSIYLVVLMIWLTGCEGASTANGTVRDRETNLPLDSVLVKVTSGRMQVYTDASGHFSVENGIGGCSDGCKDITVEFSKIKYKTFTGMEDAARGIVYLEKE